MDSKTVSLLRAIGSPFVENRGQEGSDFSKEMYRLAYHNKIPLTYLNSLSADDKERIPKLDYHHKRFRRMLHVAENVTNLFEAGGLDHAIFKTLKPFPEEVADIDVIVFGNLKEATKILTENRYGVLEKGPSATTLCDLETHGQWRTEIMIDLHEKISVSNLEYIDKWNLKDHIVTKDLWGFECQALSMKADLLITIAHSVFKEGVMNLADYYTTLNYLSNMEKEVRQHFVKMVEENQLKKATRWFLTLTELLHEEAHRLKSPAIIDLLTKLDGPWSRAYQIIKVNNPPPYQCDFITLASIFTEKLKDKNFRFNIPTQLSSTLNPDFMRRFLKRKN